MSSRNLFGHGQNVEVLLGPLFTLFPSVLCRVYRGDLVGYVNFLLAVGCTPAWYNVTKAFDRDATRFRSYYAAQDTVLCLGRPDCQLAMGDFS